MDSLISVFDAGKAQLERVLADALRGCDDGELFMEYSQSEGLVFDNGKLKAGSFDTGQGFGLRAVSGESSAYAHSGEMTLSSLKRAADAVSSVKAGHTGTYADAPKGTNRHLYGEENPLLSPPFDAKAQLLQEIDAYARAKDPRVRQVSASISGSWQVVEILRADGQWVRDVRPLVRVNVSLVVGQNERHETGSYGMGGRTGFNEFITTGKWKHAVNEACVWRW